MTSLNMYLFKCSTNDVQKIVVIYSSRFRCKKLFLKKSTACKICIIFVIRNVFENSKLIFNYSAIKIVNPDLFYRHQVI